MAKSLEIPYISFFESDGDKDWRAKRVCKDMDPDIFFHPEGQRGRAKREHTDRALEICNTCPVIRECGAYAIMSCQEFGIWGMPEDDLHEEVAAYKKQLKQAQGIAS